MDYEALLFARNDTPGLGYNRTSFYHPDYEALEMEAKTVAGCSLEARGALYRQIQEIMYDEQPFIWLYTPKGLFAVNRRVGGATISPGLRLGPSIHEWYIKSE